MEKKILVCLAIAVALSSCRNDNSRGFPRLPNLDPFTQNRYDDHAIREYLDTHYFDERGKIKVFDAKSKADNTKIKLSALAKALPSGVVYVIRPNAQPVSGELVKNNDVLEIMQVGFASRAIDYRGKVQFTGSVPFFSTVNAGGIPVKDPLWHYVGKARIAAEQKILDRNRRHPLKADKSYFEIEGFQEGIKQFRSFTLGAEAHYNLQGLIIVPSRAAFAKDRHYNYIRRSLNDYTFFFNFQLYGARARTPKEE